MERKQLNDFASAYVNYDHYWSYDFGDGDLPRAYTGFPSYAEVPEYSRYMFPTETSVDKPWEGVCEKFIECG